MLTPANLYDQFKIGQPRFKKFILSSGQDVLDAKNKWFSGKYGNISYGVSTDGYLIDCFGIIINPYGYGVTIAYRDQYGAMTKPYS